MEKCPVLFITVCSHTKNSMNEINNYSDKDSINNYIYNDLVLKLWGKRKSNLDLLKQTRIDRDGKCLQNLPSNASLTYGQDFLLSSQSSGKYLPAIKRYSGRFYQQLGEENDRFCLLELSNIHLLIISGLYGVLSPFEYIQDYSLNIIDSTKISNCWQEDDFLTKVIHNYVTRNKIKIIVEIIGDDNYKHLINWHDLQHSLKGRLILHTFSLEYGSGDILSPLGDMLKTLIYNNSCEDYKKIKNGSVLDTKYKEIHFTDVVITSKNPNYLAEIEIKRNQLKLSDRVRRMKANLNHAIHSIYIDNNIHEEHEGLMKNINHLVDIKIISESIASDIWTNFLKVRNEMDYGNKIISDKDYSLIKAEYFSFIKTLTKKHGRPFTNLEEI